ncbi:hypothetical protein HZS_3377 [Henneguya salminicola]|nr:hypothetical protein HZS_3377 [Henneguya salminicola]
MASVYNVEQFGQTFCRKLKIQVVVGYPVLIVLTDSNEIFVWKQNNHGQYIVSLSYQIPGIII